MQTPQRQREESKQASKKEFLLSSQVCLSRRAKLALENCLVIPSIPFYFCFPPVSKITLLHYALPFSQLLHIDHLYLCLCLIHIYIHMYVLFMCMSLFTGCPHIPSISHPRALSDID